MAAFDFSGLYSGLVRTLWKAPTVMIVIPPIIIIPVLLCLPLAATSQLILTEFMKGSNHDIP